MANFNLADYETVDSRIKRFYADHPYGRITTELVDFQGEPGSTRWVVKAYVWRGEDEDTFAGTGLAFENDGDGMANKTSALENCETSAIGRALANIGYSGDKRSSREEMTKATPEEIPAEVVADWVSVFESAESLASLQKSWEEAGAAGVTRNAAIVGAKDARKKALS